MTEIDYFLWYGSIFSPVLPLLLVRRNLSHYQVVAVLFISVSFLADLISRYLIHGRNYFFLHAYGFVEALLLLYFYSIVLDRAKTVTYFLGGAYLAFYIFNSIFWEWNEFNTIGRTAEAALMIILSISLFYQFYTREEDIFIDRSPLFWMNIAVLTYFSGAFFSFILSQEILLGSLMSWRLHNMSNIIKNLLFGVALWRINRK